ncbi:MerR family transcriptional regulator [Paenibacillaceae bacterium WGS1546]|uniref:MerR family transcriptional regulator n=1 Tax=Cohnella sp. WGS1546 TaxID=3366810 RepID=UPI00372D4274
MRIKEAADKLGISARAIRLYEKKGLLSPAKQENNGYRIYSEREIWRLQTIVSLREAGMSLTDIKQALEKWERNETEELQFYLELQRAVLTSEWLKLEQALDTADRLIGLLRMEGALPLEQVFRMAQDSRRSRTKRDNWTDRWNFDRQASTHDERVAVGEGSFADYAEALDAVVARVAAEEGERGLDIGTGTGNLAGKFIDAGCAMSGVDQSREMLRLCQAKYPGMETRLGNFLALPFVRDRFDFIVSSFAFHHLDNVQQELALEEMRRVLKPSGRICIADLMAGTEDEGHGQAAYPSLPALVEWFGKRGFGTKTLRLNERLHILYACKEDDADAEP